MDDLQLLLQLKDLGGVVLLIISLFYTVKYLAKRNDSLAENLNASHAERENQLIELIREINEKHEACNEKYTELLGKSVQAIENNTNVIEKLLAEKNSR